MRTLSPPLATNQAGERRNAIATVIWGYGDKSWGIGPAGGTPRWSGATGVRT